MVSLIVAVAGTLFVGSYGIALGDPTPRNLPIGVVGDAAFAEEVGAAFDAEGDGTFVTQTFASLADADDALARQQIFAIIERGAGDELDVVVSSASGASVAQLIEKFAPQLASGLGLQAIVTDAHPLGKNDPQGLVLFYLAMGAIILGFLGAVQTRINAKLSLGGEVGWDVFRSALAALGITLIVGPVLGLEAVPILPTWLTLTVAMLVASMFYSLSRVTIGPTWALLPTWILFVVVANPASGGAVPPELLPPFYEFMGRWLPTGAMVYILRDITYFPTAVNLEPILVLLTWLVVTTTAFVLVRRRRFGSAVVAGT